MRVDGGELDDVKGGWDEMEVDEMLVKLVVRLESGRGW